MEKGKEAVAKAFGNRLRVRVSGICFDDEKVLLINHKGVNEENEFWSPPGGGMDFGYSAEENLKREFKEETGLEIEIDRFLCVNEFIGKPLHAVELFFLVRVVGGTLIKGEEPELKDQLDIIKDVKFMSWENILKMKRSKLHNLFYDVEKNDGLKSRMGYILQKKNK